MFATFPLVVTVFYLSFGVGTFLFLWCLEVSLFSSGCGTCVKFPFVVRHLLSFWGGCAVFPLVVGHMLTFSGGGGWGTPPPSRPVLPSKNVKPP